MYFLGAVVPTYPEYYIGANLLSKGEYPTYTLRFMSILPTSILFKIFGYSEFVALLYPLFTSLGTIVLVYFIGKFFYNSKTGLLAAFLMSFFPMDVIYATQLISDSMLPFYVTLSVFFFILGEFSNAKNSKIKRLVFFVSAGFVLGLAYLIKIIALMFVVYYFLYFLYKTIKKRKIDFSYLYLAVGFLIVFGSESVYFYSHPGIYIHGYSWEPGDLLYHLHALSYAHAGSQPVISDSFKEYVNFFFIERNDNVHFVGLSYIIIFVSVILLIIFREKRSYFIVFLFLFTYLYLEIGPSSFTFYHTIRKIIRYTLLLAPFGTLCLAFSLSSKKFKWKYSLYLKIIFIIFLFFNSVTAMAITHNKIIKSTADGFRVKDIQQTYQVLKNTSGDIYSIGYYEEVLPFYFNYKQNQRFKSLRETESFDGIHNAYVIANLDIGVDEMCVMGEIPIEVCNPPKNWILIKKLKFDYTGKYDDNPDIFPIVYYIP